jgi:N-acetylmuramoyl-L-alanine amidase
MASASVAPLTTLAGAAVRGVGVAAHDGATTVTTPASNTVSAFGTPDMGGLTGALNSPLVGMAATADGGGYWLAAADGGVFAFGDAGFEGSAGGISLDQPVVGMAADPATGGYWLVGADGGVFAFDAPYLGSLGGLSLHAPIVGMASTADGLGYWLVASDGGVFAFGDAAFQGSTGGIVLNQPVVGMAADPATGGYWLEASDGGLFAFDAPYEGSLGALTLDAPIVGMAATADGSGYWMVAADGGVFTFGDASFDGSEPDGYAPGRAGSRGSTPPPAIGLAAGRGGYWVAYGAAPAVPVQISGPPPVLPGSPDGSPGTFGPTAPGVLSGKVIAIDPGHNGGNGGDPGFINTPIFNGVEDEACDTAGAETASGFTESQFNFNVAEYLTAELRAAGATVVLTRTSNTGVGPCVTERAAIGNDAHADAAVSIHADGGPVGGSGYAILEPVADGINNAIVGPSAVLATDLRNSFGAVTSEPTSNYDGVDGLQPRDDLGGINLSTVPKVFIECANMNNPADAAEVVTPSWQSLAANGIAQGLTAFLSPA